MTDDTTQQPQPTGDESQQEGDGTTDGRMVPYTRFKSVNDKYRAAETTIADLNAKLAAAPTDDYRQKHDALAAELDSLKLARLRDNVVHRAGLPLELASRLVGTTEGELQEDLARLQALGFSGRVQAPDIGATAQHHGASGYSLAQVSDPAYYRDNREAIQRAAREGRIFG